MGKRFMRTLRDI